MKPIRIRKREFDKFRELQKLKRKDCHAVFSSNLSEVPWPFVTSGLTPEQLRAYLRSQSPILDRIVGMFIEARESTSGGRFFIDHEGVYWKDNEKRKHRFVEWLPEEPLQTKPRSITFQELRSMQNAYKHDQL